MKKLFIEKFKGFKSGDTTIFAQWIETQDDGWLIWEDGYIIPMDNVPMELEKNKKRDYWFDFNEKDGD